MKQYTANVGGQGLTLTWDVFKCKYRLQKIIQTKSLTLTWDVFKLKAKES